MTISTVGYGDYTAHTDLEKVWSMVSMLFGALIFAGITGSLSARMTSTKGSIQVFNTKMDQVRDYCLASNLPLGQRRKIGKTTSNQEIYDRIQILRLIACDYRGALYAALGGQVDL